jgi:hypothetical protein
VIRFFQRGFQAARQFPWREPGEGLDPVLIKEIRQGMRSNRFVVPFILAQVGLLGAVGIEVLEATAGSVEGFGQVVFWIVLVFFVLLLIPLMGLMAIATEYRGRQYELLRLSGMTRWQIVRGKWFSLMLQSTLLLLSSLPYLMLRYLIGGMELFDAGLIVAGFFVLSANLCALFLAISAFRTKIGRVVSLIFLSGAFLGHAAIGAFATGIMADRLIEWMGFSTGTLTYLGVGFYQVVPFALGSTLLLLAVASSKLRFYEAVYGADRGNSLAVLYCVAPYIISFATAITLGFGGAIAWIILSVGAIRHQGGRDGDRERAYAAAWTRRGAEGARDSATSWVPKSPEEAERRDAYKNRNTSPPTTAAAEQSPPDEPEDKREDA